MTNQQIFLEATLTPGKTGREWDVTIIGATGPADVIDIEGREYIKSKNGRLYSVDAIKESAGQWDGVKVYDNHLTQAEFEAKQGMRSPVKEWLGTIVAPYWDDKTKQLRGAFKVVEDALAAKLKNAHEQGVLGAIGLSIDTFPIIGKSAFHEGQQMPLIEGFKKILSVDLVGDPAAGGGFNRILAAVQNTVQQEELMDKAEIQEMIDAAIGQSVKSALAEALAAEAEAIEEEEAVLEADIEEEDGEEDEMPVPPKKKKGKKGLPPEFLAKIKEGEEDEAGEKASEALHAIRALECKLTLNQKLSESQLPTVFAAPVRRMFEGKIFDESELDAVIKEQKQVQAAADPSGRVTEANGQRQTITAGLSQDDKFGIEFMRLMMGESQFRALKVAEANDITAPRLRESREWQAWQKDGAPDLTSFNRISNLLENWLGGNPLLDGRALEAATTSTLATVVKNTVNIMVAADYSQRERWFEPLVTTEEVNTIDEATLARLYGANTLSVVDEGAAYTELALADEEETASFVKNGNYVAVTMETMMRDKVQYLRSIPKRLTNAWFNTLSAYTSAVFTVNSAAGPALSDTGALFNATAVTTAGGHANLLTTALSYSAFGAARTAMRKQTDQPLGAGRRLLISPKFLLVPEDLETTALQIRNSELVPTQSGGATTGGEMQTANMFKGQFEVVVVPDWSDTNNWALAADPKLFPAIYHIFPRGYRTPQLFTADSEVTGAMFTNDTMRFKVRLLTYRFSSTYSCAPVADFRPLHKSNVA